MAENKNNKTEAKSQEIKVPETPGEITPENAHLVDYDNLKVKLICLVSVANAFTHIANFLKRRGWEVFVTTELKEALSQVGTYKPDFVVVSVNHPHKKIKQFPQIVMQTFNIPTIVFGEKTDAKTMSAIQASRSSHKIMGHLSGPTAQRKIKKILHDMYYQEDPSKASRSYGAEREQRVALKFSGRKTQKQGAIIFEKNQTNMRRADGYNPFKSGGQQTPQSHMQKGSAYDPTKSSDYESQIEKNASKNFSAAEQLEQNNKTATEEKKDKKNLNAAEKMKKDSEDLAAAMRELSSALGSGNLDQGEDSPKDYGGLNHGPNEKKEDDNGVVIESMSENSQFNLNEEGIENKSKASEKEESSKKEPYTMETDYTPKRPKEGYVMESDYIGRPASERMKIRDADNQSYIEKATIEIVNTMKAEEHDNPPGLGVVSRVALLSVGHDKHKGYFMIAGHDIGMSLDDFVQEFTEHFKKHSVAVAEHMEFGDYINMDCPGYDFFDNGEEGLEFNLVTSFGGGEIGVKFIHDEEAWAHAEKPEHHDKALIKTEQIVEDKPLEIDLFVHLQRNEKYYKIVGEGSELSSDRKERLVEKKTEVFINEDDVGTYRTFQTKQKAMRAIDKTVQRTTKKRAS